jgi:hypothetical protein
VINRPGIFHPQLSRHAAQFIPTAMPCKQSGLTPLRFFPRQNVPSLSNRFIFFSNLPRFYTGANGHRAAAIAQKWHRDACHEAVESDEEQWERCREEFGAK